MLVLAARRRDVRMPALGHPAASKLDVPFFEWSIELQQEHRLFEIEKPWHASTYVSDDG